MKTSAAGRALIEQREGRRLTAYRDSKGVLTIGVGHTGRMSPPLVTARMKISEAECDAMLAADLVPVEREISARVKVPLTRNEADALASWLFNVGEGALASSTVLKRLNLGDVHGAGAALMMWVKPPELAKRRRGEMEQFLRPDATTNGTALARAGALADRAEAAKAKAVASGAVAAGTATIAAGTTTAAAAHPTGALAAGGLSLAVALVSALWSCWIARQAATLSVNAAAHAALAD